MKPALRPLLACALLAASAAALAQSDSSACGSLSNAYGPFDYLTQSDKLGGVEPYHFTPQVERLSAGQSTVAIGGDIAYTLHVFPNHHRALLALARLGQRQRTTQPEGARYSVECYFERALRFRPQDSTARLLYANFLFDNRRDTDALGQMEIVATDAADNAFTHYNLGLIYLERKRYPQALQHAHRAYALGTNQPGLREQLQRLGQWQDATPAQ